MSDVPRTLAAKISRRLQALALSVRSPDGRLGLSQALSYHTNRFFLSPASRRLGLRTFAKKVEVNELASGRAATWFRQLMDSGHSEPYQLMTAEQIEQIRHFA
ncbi:MAG: hypothetical protein MK135_08815, partial [Polyangiaceae bacterium]|nr:hypothetical protein [Polyangiaceae bacterium]